MPDEQKASKELIRSSRQLRIPIQIDTDCAGKSTLVPIEIGTDSDANRHPCLG
jgi:hypothetical protein